jgi:hypothetical protein
MTDLQIYLLIVPFVLLLLAGIGYWWISKSADIQERARGS